MVRTSGSSDSIADCRTEDSVGLRKTTVKVVDRRMRDGTGCFFRRELDLNFFDET